MTVGTTTYYDRIDGRRVIAGKVLRVNGQRIRCHAVRSFGRLSWTCDTWHRTWAKSASEAVLRTTPADRDILTT